MRARSEKKVRTKLLGYIAEIVGFKEKELTLRGTTTIRDILGNVRLDENRIIVLINGKPGKLNDIVEGGEYIVVMPIVGGG